MMPGDECKQVKISMLEGKWPDKKRSKLFKRMIHSKLRAVLKERTMAEIKNEI